MADRLWRAQVTLPLATGVPEDAIVNTLYFDDDDDPIAGPEDTATWIFAKVGAFFSAVGGAIYGDMVGEDRIVKLYDMADPEPRVPLFTEVQPVDHVAGDHMPSEVAICASYAADVSSGQDIRRRRGRLYLGPVRMGAGEMVGAQLRPTLAVQTAIRDAMEDLATPFLHPASPGYFLHWAIYSPTTHAASTVGEAFNDVIRGWVDNAFDTQRRRGPDPTSRVTFSI